MDWQVCLKTTNNKKTFWLPFKRYNLKEAYLHNINTTA